MSGIREKGILDNPIIAQEVKVGICKGKSSDGFVIAFKGTCDSEDEAVEMAAVIPIDGITELIQILFSAGMRYQEETGVDIGFADVIREKNNE